MVKMPLERRNERKYEGNEVYDLIDASFAAIASKKKKDILEDSNL